MRFYFIEIGLEEMLLLAVLEQSRPELSLCLLFPQDKVDATAGDMVLRLRGIDLREEFQLNRKQACLGGAREGELRGLQVKLDGIRRAVIRIYGQVDDILGRLVSRGALRPDNC